MVCYPSQLGGTDFCVDTCDPSVDAPPGFTCVASGGSGVLLKSCVPPHPSDAGTPEDATGVGATNGCPANLSCYRTDLLNDVGVCLWMNVCTTDSQCADSTHPRCTATIIHDLFPSITTNNLYCAKDNCASSGSSCPAEEVCSASFFTTPPGGDICVPPCIKDADCPPNFACAFNPVAQGAPYICLPGVPGERCTRDQDCMLGNCLDTGAGFRECIFLGCPGDSSQECVAFDVGQDVACANKQCVGLTAYHGTACVDDTDCPSGQSCILYSPYGATGLRKECRLPCDADLTCPPRAGVPEVCLNNGQGGCYPGEFGLPCTDTSQCLQPFFQCLPVAPDPRTVIDSPSICTTTCMSDDDCRSMPAIRTNAFCEDGLCRLGGQAGVPCDRPTECFSQNCVMGTCSS
jgi:hypothetical protein